VGFSVSMSDMLPTEGNQTNHHYIFVLFSDDDFTFPSAGLSGVSDFFSRGTGPRDIAWIAIPLPSLRVVVISVTSCCCVNCS